MEHDNSELHWSQAQQRAKEIAEEERKAKEEYDDLVNDAYVELMDHMSTDAFRSSDFDNVCSMYGVDPDDLLERMI